MAIIIDPTLSTTDFSEIIKICKENPKEVVIICLSPMQKEYLEKKVSNVVKCVGINWPIEERLKLSEIYSYWDKLEEVKEAKVKPWPDIFPYEINVAKIYRYYLIEWGALFLLVNKVLNDKLFVWKDKNLIVIGKSPIFFTAIDNAITNKKVSLQKIYMKIEKKQKSFSFLKSLFNVLTDEMSLWYYRRMKNGKMIYIDRHRQTLPLFLSLKAQTDIKFFTKPYSVINKRLLINSSQVLIEEVTNKLSAKIIYLLSKYPLNSNKFWEKSTLKDFINCLQFIVKNEILVGFYIWKNFDKIKPNAALCINWSGNTHQFINSWCRANNKHFMVLQHGIQSGGCVGFVENKIDSDMFLCWGEEMKESFINAYPENRKKCIRIVGNPVYEKLTHSNQPPNTELLSKNRQSYQILIAPSLSDFPILLRDYEKIFWDEMEMAIIKIPEIKWSLKLHNLYSFKDGVEDRFKKLGVDIIKEGNIFNAMKNCQLVVTNISTAALDAMVMQKSVIIFNLFNQSERFSEFGAGIIIKEKGMFCKELEKLIKKGSCDSELLKKQEKFLNAFICEFKFNNFINIISKILRNEDHECKIKKRNRS